MRWDLMHDAISRMKYGMTVSEAIQEGICIKYKEIIPLIHKGYEKTALCNDIPDAQVRLPGEVIMWLASGIK